MVLEGSHRTTGCFDDRLLTMMTDTGFFVALRVGYNFRFGREAPWYSMVGEYTSWC